MSRLDWCQNVLLKHSCYDWKNDNCDGCNIFQAYCEGAARAKRKMERPTDKQMELIEDIQEYTDKVFTGNTKEEASVFIDQNIEQYKLELEVRSPMFGYE